MPQPFFSIVIPTRGRPKFLRDALVSALRQDFDDFEVVVSDNYNDDRTLAVLHEFKEDRRLRCVRTDRLLNMPEHWDFATQHAHGQYVLILTDRSVLKQGALKTIQGAISSSDTPVEVCSWRWSSYKDSAGAELGDNSIFQGEKHIYNFSSRKLAEDFTNGLGWLKGVGWYVFCLPRGLNSCYKNTLMHRIRDEFGTPFKPLSPDYYSAFVILGTAQEVMYIDKSLVIFQGEAYSQGARSISGIDTGYIKSLGVNDIYTHVPIKSPLVKSLIFEDFLVARKVIGGNLKDVNFDWPAYFENCYSELLIKKEAGILPSDKMDELFAEWTRALSTFDQPTQNATKEKVQKLIEAFKFPAHLKPIKVNTHANSYLIHIKLWIKKLISAFKCRESPSKIKPDKKEWQSVLKIAGF